ncbi:MAG: hypothetical protein LQ350_003845 [Teloschistes chrysophthalmus]|nr:MAG: hypothetical protein LQ350_003845 [Niorma chrysophthalma]
MSPAPDAATLPLQIVILGTCDTKLQELLHLRSQVLLYAEAATVLLVDVGGDAVDDPAISISQKDLLKQYGPSTTPDLSTIPRNRVTETMADCATACLQDLHSKNSIHGVISPGGSSGTSLTSAAMRRALPFLMPKLIVSTVASGDTAPYVGETDITLMYSIVDIAGSNDILNGVLDNAAGAIVGMARAYQRRLISPKADESEKKKKKKKRIGITMFGVTTTGVDAIRHHLNATHNNYEIYVFHATGHGGRAMERLITSNALDAIIDLTTTEIADEIVGGVMSAGPHRLEAAAKAGIPQIISLGACDIVNFGPRSTLPPKFIDEGRKVYEHNASVTLVRTNVEECRKIGSFIAAKLKEYAKRPEVVEVVIPTGGLSALSGKGGVYEDGEADEALFEAVERGLGGSGIMVERVDGGVNEEVFARGVVGRLGRLIERGEGG